MILQLIDNKESLLSTARIGFQGLFGSSFPSNSKMIQVTNVSNAHLSTKKKKKSSFSSVAIVIVCLFLKQHSQYFVLLNIVVLIIMFIKHYKNMHAKHTGIRKHNGSLD